MKNKRKIMVDSIYHHIQRINKDVEWRPEGNTSCLGYGIYLWNGERFNPSIERYSRNSCEYPSLDMYSPKWKGEGSQTRPSIEDAVELLSDKEVQSIVDLLKSY
jgi:hypothetical protein